MMLSWVEYGGKMRGVYECPEKRLRIKATTTLHDQYCHVKVECRLGSLRLSTGSMSINPKFGQAAAESLADELLELCEVWAYKRMNGAKR